MGDKTLPSLLIEPTHHGFSDFACRQLIVRTWRPGKKKNRMLVVYYFLYGLAFFSLGLSVQIETRQPSTVPMSRQLPWLAGFGFVHCVAEWSDMFLLMDPANTVETLLIGVRTIALPLSALLLIRFGAGLIGEIGLLPDWVTFARLVLLIPATLLFAYALVVIASTADTTTAVDVWSRRLLFLPGGLLVAWGFLRRCRSLRHEKPCSANNLLIGAAIAFVIYAFVAGLIVPKTAYGVFPWLSQEAWAELTGVPAQAWRAATAWGVTLLVIRAMGVFEDDRRQQLAHLRAEREQAQHKTLALQKQARELAENWVEALVKISQQIATLEPLDDVLLQIVNVAREFLDADAAALALWSEDYQKLILKAFASSGQVPQRLEVEEGYLVDATRSGKAEIFPPGTHWYCPIIDIEIHAGIIVPLNFENDTLGGLWVVSQTPDMFDKAQKNKLSHLADQAVIAVQHTLMAASLQSLAVIEERSRIAREMHDGLAQILGYLNLEMQTLQALVRQGETGSVLEQLAAARQRIDSAQADVRENILCLRTTLANGTGLIPALQEYVQEFSAETGIVASFSEELSQTPHLSPLAETQLVRIIQEALANVRKHANAQRVRIHFAANNGHLHIRIIDDGIGFDPDTPKRDFGLQTMRERAESVGGAFDVDARLGHGTHVTIQLPLAP